MRTLCCCGASIGGFPSCPAAVGSSGQGQGITSAPPKSVVHGYEISSLSKIPLAIDSASMAAYSLICACFQYLTVQLACDANHESNRLSRAGSSGYGMYKFIIMWPVLIGNFLSRLVRTLPYV